MLGLPKLFRGGLDAVKSTFAIGRRRFGRRSFGLGQGPGFIQRITPDEHAIAQQLATTIQGHHCSNRILRENLAALSQREADRNSYYSGMMTRLANDTIGNGPKFRLAVPETSEQIDQMAEQVESRWDTWARRIKLAKKLKRMRRTAAIKGECFLLLTNNPKLKGPIQLDIQVIDPARVRSHSSTRLIDNDQCVDGIDFDEHGNPIRYWILPQRTKRLDSIEPVEVPAHQVIHYFKESREEQYRGLPEALSALLLFPTMRRYTQAVLTAAELGATLPMALKVNGFWANEAKDNDAELIAPNPGDTFSLHPGTVFTLPEETELQAINPSQPTTVYDQFMQSVVCEAARSIQMPAILAWGCSGRTSFSAANIDWAPYETDIGIDRCSIECDVLDVIAEEWWTEAILVENFFPEEIRTEFSSDTIDFNWGWPRIRKHMDPDKDSKGLERLVAIGAISHEELWNGSNGVRMLRKQAKFLGVTFERLTEAIFKRIYEAKGEAQNEVTNPESEDDESNETEESIAA